MSCSRDAQQTLEFSVDGVGVITGVVGPHAIERLRELPLFALDGRPGRRVHSLPEEISDLTAHGGALRSIADDLLGTESRAVRVLFFDKTIEANWGVPWHQDRTIAVASRVEAPGFGPWSVKGGVVHVEPTEHVLRSLVSLRLHVDDCGPDNGPLQVILGSWADGRVGADQISTRVTRGPVAVLTAAAGSVVAMRGLTIHGSEPAKVVGHRRVVHVDFCSAPLPERLSWYLG